MEPSEICKSPSSVSSTQEENLQPRTITLTKDGTYGFGFTLRHFIVYPPPTLKPDVAQKGFNHTPSEEEQWKADNQHSPMDTIFIREVSKGSPADKNGLHRGDRIIAINNQPVTGKTYSDIVHLIRRSGNTIKLLVVPKEDDILQLYFASSAYQPVHRGHKQHKYFVPSCHNTKQQNKIIDSCEEVLYDENRTKLQSAVEENNSHSGLEKLNCNRFSEACLLHEQKKKHELFYAQEVSFLSPHVAHKRYLVKKDSDCPFPLHPSRTDGVEDDSFQVHCYSDTSGIRPPPHVVPSSYFVNPVQPVSHNFCTQCSGVWNNRTPSINSFVPEMPIDANHHCTSSDSRTMAFCDGKPESESESNCVAALISNTMKGLMPHLSSFHVGRYIDRDVSESGMNISGDSVDSFYSSRNSENFDCMAQKSNADQNMIKLLNSSVSDSECVNATQSYSTSAINMRTKTGVNRHLLVLNGHSDENTGCCNTSAINLVAERCHLFESGTVLAHSLERMNMYRSELSRMSKPNHIVSQRMAHFEKLSPTSSLPPSPPSLVSSKNVCEEKTDVPKSQEACTERCKQKQDNASMVEETLNRSSSALGCTSTDQGSSDCLMHEDNQLTSASLLKSAELSLLSSGVVLSSKEESNGHRNPAASGVVYRRKTVPASEQDECHAVRRISYLRATAEDRMSDDLELSDEEYEESSDLSHNKDHRIQKLKAFFGEKTPRLKHALQPVSPLEDDEQFTDSSEVTKSVYGWLICKVVAVEGKRSSDRSWRHVWAILRNSTLYLLKERREPSTRSLTCDDHIINVKQSVTNVANDYQKRKHVLRLTLLNGTEYLVQAENHASMMEWLQALQVLTAEVGKHPSVLSSTSVLEKAAAYEQQIQSKSRAILHQAQHPVKKLVFRHRSPSESSPSVKTRRASQGDELVISRIGVIWRDRMVQGWKKVHGSSSPNPTKCASFGVRLEDAPGAVCNEHVPLLVELCAQIVETRGLDMIGIYRVPGNNAAVSFLTEAVNQGLESIDLSDTRWNDVNIVSSLLKAYFRKLPEPLLTSHLYPKFIFASKIDDPLKRLVAVKKLLQELPVHHYETLQFLMHHLKKVVDHSDVNKMEARNLAIVFGPTLVRARDNNMIAMVTDMSHQCYLIETLITYVNWLFEDDTAAIPFEINVKDKRKTHPPPTVDSTALLNNISKLDRSHGDGLQDTLPQEIFSSLRSTAVRHLRNRNRKKTGEWESELAYKRSGIIEQDDVSCGLSDVMDLQEPTACNPSMHNRSASTPDPNATCVLKKDCCSNLSFGPSDQNSNKEGTSVADSIIGVQQGVTYKDDPMFRASPCNRSSHSDSDEIVLHTYDELSALAQEKIRNFERETKALLKRSVTKPKAASQPGHIEWEQIEREWQKAKRELEQEDLLDHLADDPSFLSLLLCRGDENYHSDSVIAQHKDSSQNKLISSNISDVSNTGTKTSADVAIYHNLKANVNQSSSFTTCHKSLSVSLMKEQFGHPCVMDCDCVMNHSEESVHHNQLSPVVTSVSSASPSSSTSIPINQERQLDTSLCMARISSVIPTRTMLTVTTTLSLANTVASVSCSTNVSVTTTLTNCVCSPTYSSSENSEVEPFVKSASSSNTQLNARELRLENCESDCTVSCDSTCDCNRNNQSVLPRS